MTEALKWATHEDEANKFPRGRARGVFRLRTRCPRLQVQPKLLVVLILPTHAMEDVYQLPANGVMSYMNHRSSP